MTNRVLLTGLRPEGIGFAMACHLAVERDWIVYACERDQGAGTEAARAIQRAGGQLQLIHADVSRPEEVMKVMDAVAADSGGVLHALVNNAGHAGDPAKDNLWQLEPEAFGELIRDNLSTAFLVTQAVVKRFFTSERGGHCIFLSTNNGAVGGLGQLAYGCAKQALAAMARVLAAEFAYRNVRFNVISPGIIETGSPNWLRRRQNDPAWALLEGCMNPSGRVGKPQDVANLVGFLLSDEASFINACDIAVDGGLRGTGILFPGVDATDARATYVAAVRALRPDPMRSAG
jgi:3-oxoacyl-[acyl-carrier protein] reductase